MSEKTMDQGLEAMAEAMVRAFFRGVPDEDVT